MTPNKCDVEELKFQVREKAIAELKKYIEGGGRFKEDRFWGSRWKSTCKTFTLSESTWKSITQDCGIYILEYLEHPAYSCIVTKDVEPEVQAKRKAANKEFNKLPKKEKERPRAPYYEDISTPTPPDEHSEWFVETYENMVTAHYQEKECAKLEAILQGKRPGEKEKTQSVYEEVIDQMYPAPSNFGLLIGALAVLALIVFSVIILSA